MLAEARRTEKEHREAVTTFKNLCDVAWAADGRSLFATAQTIRGGQLLHIMLDGSAHLLRVFDSETLLNPRLSPDGRSLLLGVVQTNSNAWVIES